METPGDLGTLMSSGAARNPHESKYKSSRKNKGFVLSMNINKASERLGSPAELGTNLPSSEFLALLK